MVRKIIEIRIINMFSRVTEIRMINMISKLTDIGVIYMVSEIINDGQLITETIKFTNNRIRKRVDKECICDIILT